MFSKKWKTYKDIAQQARENIVPALQLLQEKYGDNPRMVQALNDVINEEGVTTVAYLDQAGEPTIGAGSTRFATGKKIKKTDEVTLGQAVDLAVRFQTGIDSMLTSSVKQPMSDQQHRALSSLAYNIGPTALKTSTVMRKFNDGDVQGAANAFLLYNKVRDRSGKLKVNDDLAARRERERELFLGGASTEPSQPTPEPTPLSRPEPEPAPQNTPPRPSPDPAEPTNKPKRKSFFRVFGLNEPEEQVYSDAPMDKLKQMFEA